jgi:hypothetical protein
MQDPSNTNNPKRGERRRSDAAAVELPAELEVERALDTNQAAAILGHATITLAQWRMRGDGPRFFRCGRSIRYRLGDLIEYRNKQTIGK